VVVVLTYTVTNFAATTCKKTSTAFYQKPTLNIKTIIKMYIFIFDTKIN